MWQSVKVLNVFNTLTLIQIFWKTKTFFKKLEYRFLVESTKIENASFPYKTAMSEANVKTNRIVSTKWTYHKERSFAINHFIFFNFFFNFLFFFSIQESLVKSCFDDVHVHTFRSRCNFIWRWFSLWVSISKYRSFCAITSMLSNKHMMQ